MTAVKVTSRHAKDRRPVYVMRYGLPPLVAHLHCVGGNRADDRATVRLVDGAFLSVPLRNVRLRPNANLTPPELDEADREERDRIGQIVTPDELGGCPACHVEQRECGPILRMCVTCDERDRFSWSPYSEAPFAAKVAGESGLNHRCVECNRPVSGSNKLCGRCEI